ncbi:glycosyltransferase [Nostoc sp.]|uniref:glycosyltransferase n=1 Tax=Nostoc sp. TaxID=1180 RepID=UPI002FF44F39
MKIAIISTMAGSPWGGSEYLWASIAEKALNEGHEVFISICDWSISHTTVKKLKDLGACLLPRPRFFKPLYFLKTVINCVAKPSTKQLLSQLLNYPTVFTCKPDVICISQGGSYDVAHILGLRQLLRYSGIPYSIICQFNSDSSLLSQVKRKSIYQFFKNAKFVAFVSEQNYKLAEHHLACSLSNTIVVKNPVNLLDHSLVPFPQSSTPSFACVARLETFYKGQDILFKSLSSEIWRERDWQCCLYGSGLDEQYLKLLSRHYGIENRIQFMGHINDVRSIWAENHILVLPSRAEGTPLSLVEAMLCGRPAVVTDVGGNADWIEENNTGFIAEAPTAKHLNIALEKAWLDRENWQQMGLKAHNYAKNNIDERPGKTLLNLILNSVKS